MGFFDRFRRRQPASSDPLKRPATEHDRADLEAFLTSRDGVEGYVEPDTPVYSMSLVLVAGDGEHIRRPIKDADSARKLMAAHGAPLYDARTVGYPRRMKAYREGVRPPKVSLDDLPPLDLPDDGPSGRSDL